VGGGGGGGGGDEEPPELVGGEVGDVVARVFDESGVELAFGNLALEDLLWKLINK